MLIKPYASLALQPRLLEDEALVVERAKASTYLKVPITQREANDLIMLGIGAFTPLTGFMSQSDWENSCEHMTLQNGCHWPIPVCLSVTQQLADAIKEGESISLIEPSSGDYLATMQVIEKYQVDKHREALCVYGTSDPSHPGVRQLLLQGNVNLAGPVKVLSQGNYRGRFSTVYLTPHEMRNLFLARGWQTIAAFQTRNPMHRAHEFIVRAAMKICEGVVIHSVLGELKADDVPAEVRIAAIDALLKNHFKNNNILQAGFPFTMRYAGPREALLHAIVRQNFGCTHLIVGRDHAGVKNFYPPYAAQKIFEQIPRDTLQIQAINMQNSFWCEKCKTVVFDDQCSHAATDQLIISGTRLRELLSAGKPIPENFSRPEVLAVLKNYYQDKSY